MPRIHSIDYLKILVAAVVVMAHTGLIVGDVGPVGYVLGFSFARAAVPMFAVISGFLFHATWQNGRARIWLTKLLVAYAVWLAFYLPVWLPDPPTPWAVLSELIFGPLHLWYIAALFVAILLLLGVLTAVPDPPRARRLLGGLALAGLITGTLLQALHFGTSVDLPMNAYRNGLFVEFPYATLGFLLADRISRRGMAALPSRRVTAQVLLVLAALRLAEATGYLHLYGPALEFPPEFPFLAAAFSVFILLYALRLPLPAPRAPLAFLSVVVYFLHFFVLLVALKLGVAGFAALATIGFCVPVLIGLALLKSAALAEGRMPASVARRLLRGALRLSPRRDWPPGNTGTAPILQGVPGKPDGL